MNIIKAYAVKNNCYIAAQKMVPQGIVIHSTGANNPNLKRYVDAVDEVGINQYGNHWNVDKPGGKSICVHAFIGYDKNKKIQVAEILPLNICCWGIGRGRLGSYNYDPAYIQIEICEDNLTNKDYYKKAFSVAAEYCTELCKTYNISIDNIVGHCEAYRRGYGSNHSDPEHWMKKFGETMDNFRKQVSEILKTIKDDRENIDETENINQSFQKGDLVSIDSNATYYNGKSIPSWVKTQNWYVATEPTGDRIVIDKNENGTNSICSPIYEKYLTLVRKANIPDNTNTSESATSSACPYRVKVVIDSLNIRKGAGTNTAKVGKITDKGVYTVVEEKNGIGATKWGKLKSGVGWISLDYVKKL